MFGLINKLFASVGVIIASVFGVGNTPVEPAVSTTTPTPLVEKSATPTPKIIYVTVTPKLTVQAPTTPKPTPTPSSVPTSKYIPTPISTPNQDEPYRQSLNAQINNLIQQRYQQLLAQQQQQQKYNDQLSSLVQQINQIKDDYYVEVENIENQTIPMTFINGQISKLTQDTNQKINQLTSQYNLLLSQQGAPLNYQVSQNLTLPNTSTVWRIDGSLNGMDGTITGSNGQSYRWDCVNPTSCTLY